MGVNANKLRTEICGIGLKWGEVKMNWITCRLGTAYKKRVKATVALREARFTLSLRAVPADRQSTTQRAPAFSKMCSLHLDVVFGKIVP